MARQQNNRGQRADSRSARSDNRKAAGAQRPAKGQGSATSRGKVRSNKPVSRPAVPTGSFLEGRRAAAEALRTGYPVKRALVAENSSKDVVLGQLVDALRAANVPVQYAAREQLEAISSHGAHQGIALEVGDYPYADLRRHHRARRRRPRSRGRARSRDGCRQLRRHRALGRGRGCDRRGHCQQARCRGHGRHL